MFNPSFETWSLVLFLAVTCSGCAVGPDYVAPEMKVPDGWSAGADAEARESGGEWWRDFDDPVLVALIDRALAPDVGSRDLATAEARLREARALYRQAYSPLFPSLDAGGAYSRARRSESLTSERVSVDDTPGSFSSGRTSNLFSAGFDAAWELDIFGGTRRAIEAADADVDAAVEQRNGVVLSLTSEIARNYLKYRELGERLAIAQENIAAQAESLKLTEARFQAGLVSELDVTQARAQLATTRSQVPSLERERSAVLQRLAVLTGGYQQDVYPLLEPRRDMPFVETLPPTGLPSDILRQRPDVRAAERSLHAATARIGVAVAELFPQFSLTASAGYESRESSALFDAPSRFWSIVPGVRLPIFNAGRLAAGIDVAEERERQALFQYEQTVLASIEEAENALDGHQRELARLNELTDARDANRRAMELSRELYREGLVDFLRVLEAQRSLYLSQDQVAQSRGVVMAQLIALHKALGGGWRDIAARSDAGR